MLTKRSLMALGAALSLLLILWAATSLSFSWRPAPSAEESAAKGRSDARKQRIAEAQRRPSTIDYERLDRRFQLLMSENAMVGLAVGIVENGEISFLKGYGETVAGSGQAVTPDTVFRWASVSKGVAGDMVAKLAAEGKVALNDPISRYSASLRLPEGAEQRATVADVLAHSLGIFGHANDSKLEDGIDPRLLRGDLASLNLICPVGQCHSYQNVAYDAASEVVERATGMPYQQAVEEMLFRPLGMRSASLTREGLLTAPSWAQPHRGGKNSKPVEVTQPYYSVPAAGGVNSSIKDLAVWMQAQMGLDPSVLSDEVLAAVQQPRIDTPRELRRMRNFRERLSTASYGLGWRIYDYGGHKIVGHRGGVTGYRSVILFDPRTKSGVVALWNSSTSKPVGLEFEVMDMILQLEQRDWLKLDGKSLPEPAGAEAEEPAVTDSGP